MSDESKLDLDTYNTTLWIVVGEHALLGKHIEEFWSESEAERYARVMVYVEEEFVSANMFAVTVAMIDKELIKTFISADLE